MANYRQIHVSMWKDEWILELEPAEKLLFVYLFSNESTSLSGLYKIAKRVICFETGLSMDFVSATLEKFAQAGKIYYEDGLIWVVNLRRYNRGGPKVYTHILADVAAIPDCNLKRRYLAYYATETSRDDTSPIPPDEENIPYPYGIDTTSGSGVKCNEMKCNESISADAEPAPNFPPPTGDLLPESRSESQPESKAKAKRSARLPDPRSKHPAILCAKGIAGKFPPIEIYEDVIQVLGDAPDGPRLAECRKAWVARGYNGNSWNWLLDWYTNGIPTGGKPKPQPEQKTLSDSGYTLVNR